MSRSGEDALTSVSAKCQAIVSANQASCEVTADHVRESKKAVGRSLQLLASTKRTVSNADLPSSSE